MWTFTRTCTNDIPFNFMRCVLLSDAEQTGRRKKSNIRVCHHGKLWCFFRWNLCHITFLPVCHHGKHFCSSALNLLHSIFLPYSNQIRLSKKSPQSPQYFSISCDLSMPNVVYYIIREPWGRKERVPVEDEQIIELFWRRSENAITETSKKHGAYCTYIAFNILQNIQDSEEWDRKSVV